MPKVLVVDDDKNFRTSVGYFLASKGYESVFAKDGPEAIAKCEESAPQAILLDVLLPKLNGLDVCKKIRDAGKNVPIIMTSAIYKKPYIQNEARTKYGATDYLVKPIKPEELLERLERLTREEVSDDDSDIELVPITKQTEESEGTDTHIPREGEIRKDTLVNIVRDLGRAKASGVLEILFKREKRMMFFLNGKPVFASSFNFSEPYTKENVLMIIKDCLCLEEGSFYFNEGLDFLDYVPTYDLPLSV